jgi:hypothetical protein
MANTYTLISKSIVGNGGSAQIDFNSIPQTYKDLLIKTSTNADNLTVLRVRFNSISSSDYTQTVLRGTGGAFSSYNDAAWDTLTSFSPSYNSDGANIFSNNEYYIANYTSSNPKTLSANNVSEANSATAYVVIYAGLLNTSSPITSINLSCSNGSFNQYSTFYLYGIKNS